ncbi:MAG: Gfo/Idh/MocA family oxidoreductase [Planctomycetota bacterium]
MDDGKLGVAIHGAGQVAYAHAASWLKSPHAKIVWVTSRRKESAQRLVDKLGIDCAVGDDYDQVVGDPRVDIVNLSGPNHVHTEQGIAAAKAGKHILMEKPMCLSMEENRALSEAVTRAGVKSVVSFVLRWNPLVENLKSLLAGGAIGELFYVEVDYWHGLAGWWTGFEWGSKLETGGSTMLTGGCHAVDAIRWLAGDEIVEVAAFGNNQKGNFEYPANVVAALRFAGGAIGKTSALFDAEMPYQFNIDLAGTEGTVRDNRLWSKKLLPGQTGWTKMGTVLPDSGAVDHHPFDEEMNHLVDCIREDRESFVNIADAYKTHEVCIAIDRSIAQGGHPVRLPLD